MTTKPTVSISRARTILPLLVRQAAAGHEILIGPPGRPLVQLVAVNAAPRPRKIGLLKGRLTVPESFDEPLPQDVLDAFEGKP
jgi:antitoxin (DNA-binding transcriptional repressor) of toxin-antitoxin stability system